MVSEALSSSAKSQGDGEGVDAASEGLTRDRIIDLY